MVDLSHCSMLIENIKSRRQLIRGGGYIYIYNSEERYVSIMSQSTWNNNEALQVCIILHATVVV